MQQPAGAALAPRGADDETQAPRSQERASERPRPRRLRAVILQYDRKKYAGSVERLIALLDGIDGIEWSLVIVDNAKPASFEHRVTGRVLYVGGDNRAWEFSAFDLAVALPIEPDQQPDAWLFVTDAYQAYGADFLSLIDRRAIELCVRHDACVGWVDSFPKPVELLGVAYQDWLRTSFVFVPDGRLRALLPFAAELDEDAIFTKDPRQPFSPAAPLSENLKAYLMEWLTHANGQTTHLDEGWHSATELSEQTLPKFRAKTCAILREHLLSTRIRRAGVPAYDFRLIPVLETSTRPGDSNLLREWEWSAGKQAAMPSARRLPTDYHIDDLELPPTVAQGERATLHVRGWLLSDPQPEGVRLELGSHESLLLPFTVARPDVLEDHPEYGTELCGFDARIDLSTLPVGEHELTLVMGMNATRTVLRRIHVLPKCAFDPNRLWIPEYFSENGAMPIALEGRLASGVVVERVELSIDGKTIEPDPRLVEQPRDTSHRYTVHFAENVALDVSRVQHELELCFVCAGGATRRWTHRFLTRGSRALACSIVEARFGPYGQNPPFVPLRLAGTLYDVCPGDVLALERDGQVLLRRPLGAHQESNRTWFDLQTDSTKVSPGLGQFALFVERGERRLCVWEQNVLVTYARPEITLDQVSVRRLEGSGLPVLKVVGWVKNHFAVDHLVIEVDEEHKTFLLLNLPRPDVARDYQSTLVLYQGFDAELPLQGLEPGERVVRVIASQHRGEQSAVTRRFVLDAPSTERFQLTSFDLERLLHGNLKRFCSAIVIRGSANVNVDGAVATLLIDERMTAEQSLLRGEGVELYLRAVPSPGTHKVRVVVTSGEAELYDSGPVEVEFAPIEPPLAAISAVDAFLDRFDIRDRISGTGSTRELVRRMLEEDCERPLATASLLEEVGERLGQAQKNPRARIARPPAFEVRPLRVLFVSWEVPCSRHGGGVLMANVLKHASRRHEITLLHGHGIDEGAYVDEVRPYCRRVLSFPWQSTDAPYCGDAKLAKNVVDEYSRELRRALEMEVLSGQYDIVNYEYSALLPYVVTVGPRVLYDHEVAYTAQLNTSFGSVQHGRVAESRLRNALRAFHVSTVQIPDLFRHVIAVTEDDASALLEFQARTRVYLQQAGVDFAHFSARPTDAGSSENRPTFVFVGNYRHNPNVDAVLFFTEQVWPDIRRRLPTARFRIVGPHAPESIQNLSKVPGIDIVGFVDDVRRTLFGATAFVAPIRTGAGMRLKVLEALAARLPVVGSELALRGLGGEAGRDYLRADSASDLGDALVSLAKNPERALAIGGRGQVLAEIEHGWEARFREREAIWHDVIADYGQGVIEPGRAR